MKNYWPTANWVERYAFAQKQAIIGVTLGEIEKLEGGEASLPKQLLFQWIGDAELIGKQNLLLNQEVGALSRLLDANGIRYAVVKGQVLATYYERPELRTSGDIDFFVPEDEVEKTKALLCKEWGVVIEKDGSPCQFAFVHNGVLFEMHYKLFFFYNQNKDKYWEYIQHFSLGHRVLIDSTSVATLEPTVHALYVFFHLYHHLVEVGVGLRQFFDLAMLLKKDVDGVMLMKHLKELGMVKAFKACCYILTEYLGVDANCLPLEIDANDSKFGQRIFDVVLYRGNLGHYNKRSGWSGIGHQLESACIKISHFVKFFWLSPSYHLGWMRNRVFGF